MACSQGVQIEGAVQVEGETWKLEGRGLTRRVHVNRAVGQGWSGGEAGRSGGRGGGVEGAEVDWSGGEPTKMSTSLRCFP